MTWLYAAWRWLASSKLAQAAIAIGGLISYHVFAKWRAAREAVKEEREQARIEAHEKRAEHEGSVSEELKELKDEQDKRRKQEKSENPRDRFTRDPFD